MNNGIVKSELFFQEHTAELVHRTTQPTEDLILTRNSELRKNVGAIRDLGSKSEGGTWGRQVASIPFIKLQEAVKLGYDIFCKDQKIASKELFRYLNSEEGKPCLIRDLNPNKG